jgi:hypothetical protein
MIENCQVNDCQKRLLLAEIEQLRAALEAANKRAKCAPEPPGARGYEV